ncbi:MAG TPA: protein-disulfide reductase DsbD domain-containing protein, partial [Paracoccaceae bacterium]|nr:protein-disulfide reductase DsbD domain-containing protein [Paracoccaceae bacterium]
AEDADSLDARGKREEGAFYAWTPEQAEAAAGDRGVASTLGLHLPPTIEAGAVPHLAPGSHVDFAALDPQLEKMRHVRDRRPRPIRDEKIIAGWNGLMIRALAEGAAAFDALGYAAQAARAGEALWARLWDGTRLARLWAGGRASDEGALEDYAWLALGCLALADATAEPVWRQRADTLTDAIHARFADGTGRLKMAASDGPLGPVYDSTDSATPSGESSALELLARLARRGAGPEVDERAQRLRGAIAPALAETPLLRPDALAAARILDDGESGRRRALAQGNVRVMLRAGALILDIAPGWHLTGDGAPGDLVPVTLDGAEADWPTPRAARLGFADAPVPVHEGRVEVPLRPRAGELTLRLQACSDRLCLAPETATFRLP